MSPEAAVYEQQLSWLLRQFEAILTAVPAELLTAAPPVALEGNNLLAIAKHATAVTRAYALGMGCGLPASRDRSTEFTASAAETPDVLAALAALRQELPAALANLPASRLELRFVPEQSLYGAGEPREVSAHEAIVESIRHLAIHLGELRLTRSLLEQ